MFRSTDIVSRWGEDYRPAILDQFDPVGRARWLFNENRSDLARPLLDAALADSTNNPRWTRAALIFTAFADSADVPQLVGLTRSGQANVTTAALGRLVSLAPEQALEAARRIGLETVAVHLQVLADLSGRCDESIARYLDEFAQAGANGQFARLVVDVALRLGCPLSNEALSAIEQPLFLRDAARYLDIADPARARRFRDHFARKIEIALRTGTDAADIGTGVAYLTAARHGDRCLDVSSFDALPAVDQKLSAAGAYLAQCPAATATLQAKPDGGWRYVVENGTNGAAPLTLDLPLDASTATLWTMLDSLGAAPHRSLPALRAIAIGDGNALLRVRATRLLRLSGAPAPPDISIFVRTGDHALQNEAYSWWAHQDRTSALTALVGRLGEETAGFIPQTLAQWNLSVDERRRIVDAARTSKVSGATRGLIVAMFGTVDEVMAELNDPRYARRQWAFDGLGFRDDLALVAERLPAPYASGGTTAQNVRRLAQQRDRLAGEFAELTGNAREWRIKLMLDLRQLNNTGLVLWLQSRCGGCD